MVLSNYEIEFIEKRKENHPVPAKGSSANCKAPMLTSDLFIRTRTPYSVADALQKFGFYKYRLHIRLLIQYAESILANQDDFCMIVATNTTSPILMIQQDDLQLM
ncbi:hypothetical protein Droror1_Dr00011019 [Drosera rotundifolia]